MQRWALPLLVLYMAVGVYLVHLQILSAARNCDIDDSSSITDTPGPIRLPVTRVKPQERHSSRVLIGIFSFVDDFSQYRKQYRELFAAASHLTCNLHSYETSSDNTNCRIVYTFVIGGNNSTNITRIVGGDTPTLVLDTPNYTSKNFREKSMDEFTVLNIKENMEDGKSETWLNFAKDIPGIDYIMKCDSDTMIKLDELLKFMDSSLPPSPYNKHTIGGRPISKQLWDNFKAPRFDQWRVKATHQPLYKDRGALSFYLSGEMYLMSPDVASTVVSLADDYQHFEYMHHIEDHDISTLAFQHASPLRVILFTEENKFWLHNLKRKSMYKEGYAKRPKDGAKALQDLWTNETNRIREWSKM